MNKLIEEIEYIKNHSEYEQELAQKALDVLYNYPHICVYNPGAGSGSEMLIYYINKNNKLKYLYFREGSQMYKVLPVELELPLIDDGNYSELDKAIDEYRILYNLKQKYGGDKMDKRFLEMLNEVKTKLREEAKRKKEIRQQEIREIQEILKNGVPCRKVIETITNQYGDKIASEYVYIDTEAMKCYHVSLLCKNSFDLGLGTCRCVSHPTWQCEEISPSEYLSFF